MPCQQKVDWIVEQVAEHGPFAAVLDVGCGYNVDNQTRLRDALCDAGVAHYAGLDLEPAPGVTILADASRDLAAPKGRWPLVVCCEVLEHTPYWRSVLRNCAELGEMVLATAAAPGRHPHGWRGATAPDVAAGEWYENIVPADARKFCGWLFARSHIHTEGDQHLYIHAWTY